MGSYLNVNMWNKTYYYYYFVTTLKNRIFFPFQTKKLVTLFKTTIQKQIEINREKLHKDKTDLLFGEPKVLLTVRFLPQSLKWKWPPKGSLFPNRKEQYITKKTLKTCYMLAMLHQTGNGTNLSTITLSSAFPLSRQRCSFKIIHFFAGKWQPKSSLKCVSSCFNKKAKLKKLQFMCTKNLAFVIQILAMSFHLTKDSKGNGLKKVCKKTLLI